MYFSPAQLTGRAGRASRPAISLRDIVLPWGVREPVVPCQRTNPARRITADTFTEKQVVYRIGIAPVRIDILTEITGVEFPEAWGKKVASTFFGVPVHFISLDDLRDNKQALGRSSDLKDLKQNPKRMTSDE
jgi:hypothetical protein